MCLNLIHLIRCYDRLEEPSRDEDFEFDMLTTLKPNVEELEMLLEAYFAQIDGILQKLSDVGDLSRSLIFVFNISMYLAQCFILYLANF